MNEQIYGGLWHCGVNGEVWADDGFGNLIIAPVAPMMRWLWDEWMSYKLYGVYGL